MIDWKRAQTNLGVTPDGIAGRKTYAALLNTIAGRPTPLASDLGFALSLNVGSYAVDNTVDRLAAFLGEAAHETLGFTLLKELWGPTKQQQGYEGRADLGNNQPGDGFRFRGRGMFQLTGRANYADYGHRLGLDLVSHPELVERPSAAVLTALEYWKMRGLNDLADRQDWAGITRKINGGTNGAAERLAYIQKAREVLS